MRLFGRVLLAGALAWAAAACGSPGFCGDGVVDPGEECDDDGPYCNDDCTARAPISLTVKWVFNKDAAPGFDGDSCIDLGVARVEVEVAGPVTASMDESCALRQVVFHDLPAGSYTARVTPRNVAEEPLVATPAEEAFEMGTTNREVEVAVPPEAWTGDYTGTFFFRLRWGGADCDDAAPPVNRHVLLLEQDGVPVTQLTQTGDRLDGVGSGPCRLFRDQFPQSALGVPFGRAVFTILGRDADDEVQFSGSFDTFVGAGLSNPELHFDVPSIHEPDAGVPDAGPMDAGVMDAGVDGGV
jgi:hypothetical protein